MIYLDNAATTIPFDGVVRKMEEFFTEKYFNPSALYAPAVNVHKEVEETRKYILSAVGGKGKVYFTSCATESNAWVYNCGVKNKKGNIVVSMGEHASGYENAIALSNKGIDVRFVRLCADGRVDLDDFTAKVDSDTGFVSVIHCSNETGAINDIKLLAKRTKEINPKALFHSDGVQAFGKIAVNCDKMLMDMYSMSAHKIGGPKGVGALWVRDGLHLNAFLPGGGQENGMRSGTENVAGIAGFGEALKQYLSIDSKNISQLREILKRCLLSVDGIEVNESEIQSPYILSLSIRGIKAEVLQRMLCERGILIGLGSACSSKLKKNRVLFAMGRSMPHIEGNIRISFGFQNLYDDMEYVAKTIKETVKELREHTGR